MALHVTHPASGGPRRPRRPNVRFHLVHEHGDWVLRAQEEHVTNTHSKLVAPHASTSVLYVTRDLSDNDAGLKLRKPEEFVYRMGAHDVLLLSMVLWAQRRDEDRILFPGCNHTEDGILKLKRGYLRLFEWLSYHPMLVVPASVLSRLTVH